MAKKRSDNGAAPETVAANADQAETANARQSSHWSARPDLQAELDALRAENARLRAGGAVEEREIQRYPCVMYRKHRVDEKHPNGYERRRVEAKDSKGTLDVEKCDAAVAQMEKQGWVHSPDDLAA